MAFRCSGSFLLLQHQEVLMFPEALAWSVVLDGVADPANEAQGEGDDAGQLGQCPPCLAGLAGQLGAYEAGCCGQRHSQNGQGRPLGG